MSRSSRRSGACFGSVDVVRKRRSWMRSDPTTNEGVHPAGPKDVWPWSTWRSPCSTPRTSHDRSRSASPKLGDHIAIIDVRPGLGVCVAKTGGPNHWSVWGRPGQLAACAADVVRTDDLDL